MLCERCKIREANIQYTEVIGGVKTQHNFCSQCAKEMDFGQYSAIFEGEFPLSKLLSGLLGADSGTKEEDKKQQIVCPTCKTSYEEFITNSRFGCADCYSVFDLLISDNIKQLQGSDFHKGKHPSGRKPEQTERFSIQDEPVYQSAEEEIQVLTARLKEAIRREEYEIAAQCRDKIKELKEGKADA